MIPPITLLDLQEQARVAQKHVDDRPNLFVELDAKRARIEKGYTKVETARQSGADADAITTAEGKLAILEDELALTEQAIEIPWYMTAALVMIVRDALKWSRIPEGSTVSVNLPGVYALSARLDNLPEEPPF